MPLEAAGKLELLPGRVGRVIAARETGLRKVRTPQSRVVGNTHPG